MMAQKSLQEYALGLEALHSHEILPPGRLPPTPASNGGKHDGSGLGWNRRQIDARVTFRRLDQSSHEVGVQTNSQTARLGIRRRAQHMLNLICKHLLIFLPTCLLLLHYECASFHPSILHN
ncbi:uncharacterized protein CC84DRAFT_316107 [Paraphaeosphaeria sporulosa]|uniref:Uncharacterized protein n=1 Tax=Paraphaeosphaeria sporulosa TaxID=1460663 RepID=A0A177BYJ0_9PLEO|nr:uncharacterized protein CC84DRAFT_316107 [Paraphaeosphaeria sporulosa]OAG00594.1 hypothetical protein CC84DRAFT_316107 [Paraphaeosphaeria sporulosa]